jgi:glycosyltransferase involved in cell wall biosynthesis
MLVEKQKISVDAVQHEDFTPIRIVEIELGQPLSTVQALDDKTGRYYRRARCLVRLHDQPLGLIELQLDEQGASPREYAPLIWRILGKKINEHLLLDGLPAVTGLDEKGLFSPYKPQCIEMRERFLENAPFASIIVATHDRPSHLVKCLHSLLALQYTHYEIIVVDNAPSTTATAELVQDICRHNPHVRYVREDRPGLSWARNCGIEAAQGEILAFTDDDVVVDRYWLVERMRAFNIAADVACVTGLVLPLELEAQAQLWFEERAFPARSQDEGFYLGFDRGIFDMRNNDKNMPLHPYIAGRFGGGSSMAFTKAFLQSISGFDPALGAGSPTLGGEDLAAFFQAITRGYKLVYEPAALVYHCHRRDYKDLYKQIYSWGTGFTAYLTKCLLADPRLIFDFIVKLPPALFFVLSRKQVPNRTQSNNYPKELDKVEMRGMLRGPLLYLHSLWALRGMRKLKK